jgi:predicted metal-dependent phosphoesterase TrpH
LRRSPFTAVPGRLAELARPRRADLHIHTTASDGEFTASQVGALARQANLAAVAITDHDTLTFPEDVRAAAGEMIEVIPGVEISASFQGREVHLLGYFISCDHSDLNRALSRIRDARRERFHEFVARLAASGTILPPDRVRLVAESSQSLGRRHLARLIVECGFARTRTEAFHRYLSPQTRALKPKLLLPIEEAIHLVRAAGGVASLAHPAPELDESDFAALAAMGLAALEAEYPWNRSSRGALLREAARGLNLAVTGGSDCHGPDPSHRRIGSHGITRDELSVLRGWRGQSVPATCRI